MASSASVKTQATRNHAAKDNFARAGGDCHGSFIAAANYLFGFTPGSPAGAPGVGSGCGGGGGGSLAVDELPVPSVPELAALLELDVESLAEVPLERDPVDADSLPDAVSSRLELRVGDCVAPEFGRLGEVDSAPPASGVDFAPASAARISSPNCADGSRLVLASRAGDAQLAAIAARAPVHTFLTVPITRHLPASAGDYRLYQNTEGCSIGRSRQVSLLYDAQGKRCIGAASDAAVAELSRMRDALD